MKGIFMFFTGHAVWLFPCEIFQVFQPPHLASISLCALTPQLFLVSSVTWGTWKVQWFGLFWSLMIHLTCLLCIIHLKCSVELRNSVCSAGWIWSRMLPCCAIGNTLKVANILLQTVHCSFWFMYGDLKLPNETFLPLTLGFCWPFRISFLNSSVLTHIWAGQHKTHKHSVVSAYDYLTGVRGFYVYSPGLLKMCWSAEMHACKPVEQLWNKNTVVHKADLL